MSAQAHEQAGQQMDAALRGDAELVSDAHTTPFLEEAVELRRGYAEWAAGVLADRDRTAEARQRELDEGAAKVSARLRELGVEHRAELEARSLAAMRRAFGPAGREQQSFRELARSSAGMTDEAQALAAYGVARQEGDGLWAKAIVAVARSNGWTAVVRRFVADHPEVRGDLAELDALADQQARWQAQMLFGPVQGRRVPPPSPADLAALRPGFERSGSGSAVQYRSGDDQGRT